MRNRDRCMSVSAIGLDVHYKFSSVTMRDKEGKVVARERLEHPDRSALRERLSQWPKGVPAVLEASFGWGWLSDEMAALGIDVQLSNCYKVEQMRKARGWAKTNKKDADLLSLLPGEADPWWRIWLAPPGVRDQREWMRYRSDLVAMQTQTKSRVHAVFHRHGVFHDFSDLFGGKGRVFLAELCRQGRHIGGQLPPGALAALRGQVRLLDQLRRQLAEIAGRLRRELERDELTRRLASVAGFGRILSHVLKAEIGQIERFGGNHNRLASYSLLGPRAMQRRKPSCIFRRYKSGCGKTLKWMNCALYRASFFMLFLANKHGRRPRWDGKGLPPDDDVIIMTCWRLLESACRSGDCRCRWTMGAFVGRLGCW